MIPFLACASISLAQTEPVPAAPVTTTNSVAATPPVPTVPSVPLGLAMTSNSPNSITLAWYRQPNNDATSYNVFFSDKPDGTYTKFTTVTERTATHDKLTPGTAYYYKVSALNANGESAQSKPAQGMTIAAWTPQPFPVKVATDMCVSHDADVISDVKPMSGKLSNLTDGSDATSCRFRKNCEIKIKLNATPSIADADYLMLHFRADGGNADWSNNHFSRTFGDYVITESADSTDGKDGTWTEVVKGKNESQMDGVIVIPNHKPKWIGIKSTTTAKMPDANDTRLNPEDLILCRLDVFRSAPAGFRNDYWIFTGDSLVVQDLPGGPNTGRTAWFSDLIHKQHPDRYPIVVHAARGGEMMKDTLPRMKGIIAALSPPNGTSTPTATIVCWESGFNDVGVGASMGMGPRVIQSLNDALAFCQSNGLIMIPVRIEFSTGYLNKETLEPADGKVFYNTLAVDLAGVDVFARTYTPYACDPATGLPYADYWNYTRKNYAAVLNTKDGVHHTPVGSDGINILWSEVADKMVYLQK
jgi:hypothetical protein